MAFPPFPSLDLAKLVLGYLAEEQLMTAYDEFLQASPYLDALQNEYDRIFMTSLKNILAEYRAVKIYVETCKPFALRKKLFQCTNLLDVVKFLINHVDLNKIQSQDTSSFRNSSEKLTTKTCEVCDSQKLTSCVCNTRQSGVQETSHSTRNSQLSARDSSVEATALSDLPGNHVSTRKKHVKTLDKESPVSQFGSACGHQDTSAKQTTFVFRNTTDNQNSQITHDVSQNVNVPVSKPMDESQEKIKEFNDILHRVCNSNTSNLQQGNVDGRVSNAGTFQDFATGVIGGDKRNIVPDSSTSANVLMTCKNTPVSLPAKQKSRKGLSSTTKTYKAKTKQSKIIVVANVSEGLKQSNEVIDVDAIDDQPMIRPKADQNKIKILSDIKVDNETLNTNLNAVLQNATSTPMIKMQTVVINGTPVYKPVPHFVNQNFTKDEIMAMPTIIITPVSGPAPTTVMGLPHQVTAPSQPAVQKMPESFPVSSNIPARSLEPLVIDVLTNSSSTYAHTVGNLNESNVVQQNPVQEGLVTTVNSSKINLISTDAGKLTDTISASVPKDNVIALATETSTPQVIPPTRRSSSTPRRTSHVRVLDFTTPRRILHETIKEVPNDEIVISKSPNAVMQNVNITNDKLNTDDCISVSCNCQKQKSCSDCQQHKSNEKSSIKPSANKKIWDTDLRALVADNASAPIKKKITTRRKKKVEKEPKENNDEEGKKESNKKKSTKSTKTASKKTKKDKNETSMESVNIKDQNFQNKKNDIPIKPTINIISGHDWDVSHQETEKTQNKSNNDEHDTPEMDRMCLEKVIGARLNISDLLETPYKQALYDIQMETPRFLGPDLPDDPMSDIKIMNIPTPRFLNSSKGALATPSSYSSRPTDYSSGGSYYKPDDQDYMPLPEHIGGSISPSKENIENVSPVKVDVLLKEKANKSKSVRPVRQCAKNVTYFNHQINKTKEENERELDDTVDEELFSDSSFVQNSPEKKAKENTLKKVKEGTPKIRPKSDRGKRSISKKYKSPLKKEVSKSFMKIRPRRPTPLKDAKGSKRRTSEVPKSQTKKRTTSKERNTAPAPSAVPTKSRRKSSIPRKLLCTNNSESSGHDSPDLITKQKENYLPRHADLQCAHDSDNEQLKLRWSDDGSQDAKPKELIDNPNNDSEDISKIQKYIETTVCSKPVVSESEGCLHIDLVKRGFDIETAKIIERDLLDTPPHPKTDAFVPQPLEADTKNKETPLEKTMESESSISNNLQIVQDEEELDEDEEEIELSVIECNEETGNYFTCHHGDDVDTTAESLKLKDNFCMEVCIDDGVSIRLRATPFITLYEHKSEDDKYDDAQDIEETQRAVSSIKFQTPLKEALKAQCFEIFDSTLTSLDTPLKINTPRRSETEVTVTEIVLEVEKVEVKEKSEAKKRKRLQSENTSDDSTTESKKTKPEAQYMLNTTNIQNIDIESVLSRLHGP